MDKKKSPNALQPQISRHDLLNYDWLQERLKHTTIYQLIKDFASFAEDETLCLVKDALQLAGHILSRDKSVLSSQLYGRLLKYDEPDIQNLLKQIQSTNQAWLRPLTSTLSTPSEPLLYTFYANDSDVEAVAISPDGKRIISYGDYLTLWDLPIDGEPITVSDQCPNFGGVVVTPDNQYTIATYTFYSLKMWDLASLEEVKVNLQVPTGGRSRFSLRRIAISSNGKYVASPFIKGLALFDLSGESETKLLESKDLECAAFTPDNRYVLAGSVFGNLLIWDLQGQNEFMELAGHVKCLTSVAVTPDNQKAVSVSEDGTLKVWDLQKRRELFTLSGHKRLISSVAITPNSQLAITGSWDKTIKVWNLKEKQEVATFYDHSHCINEVAVTPDGECVISAAMDGTLKAWDLNRLQHKDDHPVNSYDRHVNTIHDLVVTPNGKKVVSASEDGTLKVWDVATGELLHTLFGHEHVVCAIAITTDGQKVVSASGDKTLKVWDVNQGVELHTLTGHHRFVTDVVVIPATHVAISASNDTTLKVWNLDDGKEIMTLTGYPDSAKYIAIATDEFNLISAAGKTPDSREMIKVWDLKSGKEKYQLMGTSLRKDDYLSRMGHMSAILLSSDGVQLVARIDVHELIVWDWKNRVEICTVSAPSNRAYYLGFEAVVFTLDNQQILTGSTDGTIRLYDTMSGEELRAFVGHAASVNALALMPDGKRFVSASSDQSLKVWDLATGAHVATFYGDGIFTTCVVAPSGTIVAGEATGRIHFLELMGV